jgi:hypothetical protein
VKFPRGRRRGVASVVGMLFLVVIFMLAIGAQVYVSGVQDQSAQAGEQAQELLIRRAQETLVFAQGAGGLTVTDGGPASAMVVGMVLKFGNGTVYDLNGGSSPQFQPAPIPSSGSLQVAPLVPAGTCSPGTASCVAAYDAIVGGGPVSGQGVGLLTSLGNTFWYTPAAPAGGTATSYYLTAATQGTSSTAFVPVQGLAFSGGGGSSYDVEASWGFYYTAGTGPAVFAVSLPPGATLLACGGMDFNTGGWPGGIAPADVCVSAPDRSLGSTSLESSTDYGVTCTSATVSCQFVEHMVVSFGTGGGTFQLEYEVNSYLCSGCSVYVLADSMMEATPLS